MTDWTERYSDENPAVFAYRSLEGSDLQDQHTEKWWIGLAEMARSGPLPRYSQVPGGSYGFVEWMAETIGYPLRVNEEGELVVTNGEML